MCLPNYMVIVLIILGCESRLMSIGLAFFQEKNDIDKKY